MASSTDQKNWDDGLPPDWIANSSVDAGTQLYWNDGLPVQWLEATFSTPVYKPRHPSINLTNHGVF